MLESRLGVPLVLVLLGLAALAWAFYRRWRMQRAVHEQFRLFREQAAALMDRLDALRRRHAGMTSTDPEFEVPMAGATRAFHDQVGQNLQRLWERWLDVMEIWSQAQQRLSAGSGLSLSAGPIEEARALLEGGEIDALVRETSACQERLDRLNQAHEQVRELLHSVRQELASVQHEVSRGTGVLLPSDRHHDLIEAAERALADAERRIAADPIGAEELILETRRLLGTLAPLPEAGVRWTMGERTLQPAFDELASAAERLRAAASRFWSTSLLGFFVRFWLAASALSLLVLFLLPLAPLLVFLGFVLVFAAVLVQIVRFQLAWFRGIARGLPGSKLARGPSSERPRMRAF